MRIYKTLSRSNLQEYKEISLLKLPNSTESVIRLPLLGPDLSKLSAEKLISLDFRLLK